jgi:hypothetical protein
MKQFLLLLSLSLLSQVAISQCTASATNFGNNTSVPSYNISGDVTVKLNANNTITLDLASNFMTSSGPDVRAYLVNSNGASDTTLKNSLIANLDHIEFGITSESGSQSYTVGIPNGKNIADYDKVFFYCLQFNAFWDLGSFQPFTSDNCNLLLSVADNNTQPSFKIFPNPTNNYVTIENSKQLPITVSVFNMLGKRVLQNKTSNKTNITLNISLLNTGVYLLKTTSDGTSNLTRILKQ